METTVAETKVCRRCNEEKSLDGFKTRFRRGKRTTENVCKSCYSKRCKELRESSPDRIAKSRENAKKWYEKNKEQVLLARRVKTMQSPYVRPLEDRPMPEPQNMLRILELKTMLRAMSREKSIASQANVRAKKLGIEGRITFLDVYRMLLDQKFSCYLCGHLLEDNYELDHKVPISDGGTNHPENIGIACWHCNRSKTTKSVEQFLSLL